MHIHSISIASFQGLREFGLANIKPLLVVAGANGAGKSSFMEAIRFAFINEPERVGYKKDYHKLLTDGEVSGGITVTTDKGERTLTLPTGDMRGDFLDLHHCALPYLLQPSRIAEQDSKLLRDVLNRIGGAELTAESLRTALLERGCDTKRVDGVLPLLRTGVAAVAKAAADYATQAKGAWRAHTGETYGEKKAAGWKAESPTAMRVQTARTKMAATQALIGQKEAGLYAAQQAQGAANGRKQAAAARTQRMEELRFVLSKHALRSEHVNHARAELRKAEAARDALPVPDPMLLAGQVPAPAQVVHPQGCPHCGGLLEVRKGGIVAEHTPAAPADLLAGPSPEQVAEAKAQMLARSNAETEVRTLGEALAEAEALLKQADHAGAQLAELQAQESAAQEQASGADAAAQVAEYQAAIAELRKDVAAAEAVIAEAESAKAKTESAAHAHADVQAWVKISEACSPDGIPAQLTAKALGPINEALTDAARVSGWWRVRIDEDMSIVVADGGWDAGRPYALLSESERWRCDAMLAYALARVSKLGILMLDRMDVLDIAGRGQCIAWLADAIAQGEIQTAIVCATLKASPANLPDCAQAVWLDKGVCG